MEGRRIQWMGHVKRMGDNRMPRIALEKEEGGRRPRGRPRGRWEDQVWKDIERRGLQKIQVDEEETWNDRLKWRRLCTTTREVRAKKPSLTQSGDQRLKGDFRTTTNGRAGGPLARTGSLSGHLSRQRPRSTLLDLVILR
ncbi:hypothetical protein J6590_015363 [Homalodisca vitripennis]|nr:hypothetical protein J6590_015363 [Homalodisca vitripennis]